MPAHAAAPLEAWLAALERLGPGQFVHGAACLGLLGLSLLAARAARDGAEPTRPWILLAVCYGVLAADALLQLHVPWVHALRRWTLAAGHYETRRGLQLVVLYAGVALTLGGLLWLRIRWRPQDPALLPLLLGTSLLLGISALRWLSFHGTDQWLALRLLGLSLGRGLELLGAMLAFTALWRWLRRH